MGDFQTSVSLDEVRKQVIKEMVKAAPHMYQDYFKPKTHKSSYDRAEILSRRFSFRTPAHDEDAGGKIGYPDPRTRRPSWDHHWSFSLHQHRPTEPEHKYPCLCTCMIRLKGGRPVSVPNSSAAVKDRIRMSQIKAKVDTGLTPQAKEHLSVPRLRMSPLTKRSTAGPCFQESKLHDYSHTIVQEIFKCHNITLEDDDAENERIMAEKSRKLKEAQVTFLVDTIDKGIGETKECVREMKRGMKRINLQPHEKVFEMDLAKYEPFEILNKSDDHLSRVVENRGFFRLSSFHFYLFDYPLDENYVVLLIDVSKFDPDLTRLFLKSDGILHFITVTEEGKSVTFKFYIRLGTKAKELRGIFYQKPHILKFVLPV